MAKQPLALARKLRDEVRAITRSVPMRWVSAHELGLRHPDLTEDAVDQAVAVAIAKGWMLGEGKPPHSVCLTDAGRQAGKG
jgi:hypothetical protein